MERCCTRQSLKITKPPPQPEERVVELQGLEEEESLTDQPFIDQASSEQQASEQPSAEEVQTRGDIINSKNPGIRDSKK